MSKLCLGTFFKAIIRCKIKSRTITQKIIVGEVMHLIDPGFDESDDSMISNIVIGQKNPSNYVMDAVNNFEKGNLKNLIEGFKKVCSYIDPNRCEECRNLICYITENDKAIKDDTRVELVGEIPKKQLRSSNEPLEEFLAGIFIYVLKYTDNRNSKPFVNEVLNIEIEVFMTSRMSGNNVDAATSNAKEDKNEDTDEDTLIEAQRFCIRYEEEIKLLPLCQIAYDVDPLHKSVRKMYTDYKLCNSKVRKKILDLKGIPILDFSDKEWKNKCLDKYNKQIHKDGLTTKEFLYDGAKYFHRAYERYPSYEIVKFDPRIFDRPVKSEITAVFLKDNLTTLGIYIIDFYWCKNKYPDHYVEPPMDYLWNLCHLGGCPESEMTYWVCKFIIDSSYQMVADGYPVDGKWRNVSINGELIKTQEDMYYYALLQLYWLYMIERTNDI